MLGEEGGGRGEEGETYRGMMVRWIGEGWGGEVVGVDEKQATGKGGWVKGFRGSKDGEKLVSFLSIQQPRCYLCDGMSTRDFRYGSVY